jgi:hypothetical protein
MSIQIVTLVRAGPARAAAPRLHPRRHRRGVPCWKITDAVIAYCDPNPLARALRFDELFYRLRRR